MKRILFTFAFFGLMAFSSFSQVSSYSFSQATTTYTEITGGTVLGDETTDDQRFLDPAVPLGTTATTTGPGLPIGFNFIYNGHTYNVFAVHANGWISLGQDTLTPNPVNVASTSYNTPISTGSTAPAILQDRISVFGRNIASQIGGGLRFETIGTAPNRILVVQWQHYRRNNQTGEDFNFQIRLYETTNVVEFIYGTFVLNTTPATPPQVGLRGDANTDYNNRTSTTSWSTTTAGTANNATVAVSNTIVPPSGLVFRWSPPLPNDAGITLISTPPAVAALGLNDVNVTIKNFGTVDLTGATIAWKVDGVLQSPFTYSNAGLTQGSTDGPVLIGSYNFTTTGSHTIQAWTENPNGTTDQNHFNDTTTKILYIQNYGPIPYYQNFDAVWIDKLNIQEVPDAYWINTPLTGNNSWRRCDDSISAAWTTAGGLYNPAGAGASPYSARFHTRGTTNGLTGTLDLYLDFSPAGTKQLKFWHINTGGTDSLFVSMSTDGGATFTSVQNAGTNVAWNQYQVVLGTSTSQNVVLRFVARSNGGQSDIGLDQVSVTLVSPNDAGVASIDAPTNIVFGNTPVDVTIMNYGADSLTSATVQWTVNGVLQTPYSYTNVPGLAPNASDGPINIGSYNFATGGFYDIIAWTTNPNGLTDGDIMNDTAKTTVYVQEYAALPFLEEFEDGWIDKFSTRDVPTMFWNNTPITGNQSWRRDDDGAAAAWTQATQGAYTPTGANGTTHSARFHTWYATADSIGWMDLYLDFSPVGTKMLKFWYINPTGTDSLEVLISSDSAATFTPLQSMVVDAAWAQYIIDLGTSTATGTVIRFKATSDYGNDDIGIDRVEVYIPVANDVGATAILAPTGGTCGSVNDSVVAIITNYGIDTQNIIPVKAEIMGPTGFFTLMVNYAGSLASNEFDTVFIGTTNTSLPGTYSIKVYTDLSTDLVFGNDSVYGSFVIDTALPVPHVEDYESATPLANWTTNFQSGNGHGNTSFVMFRTLSGTNPTGTATMNKKLGPVNTNLMYGFDYRFVSTPTGGTGITLVTDTLFAYLSSDCGVTRDLVYLITADNHTPSTAMKHISVPLSAYNGMELIPSFFVKRGNTVNYYIDIDNVAIYALPTADAGPDVNLCYLDTLQIVGATATDYGSVYWTTSGDGTFLDEFLLNPQYAPGLNDILNSNVDLTLNVIGTYGDTVSSTITVTITTGATAFAGNDVAVCEGSFVQLVATGGNTYAWSPATGLSDPNIANPLASPSSTTTYVVTVVSSCGTATDAIVVTVNPFTVPDLGNDTTLCSYESIVLDAGAGNTSYLWYPFMYTSQSVTIDSALIGLGSSWVWVTTTNGSCTATDSILITINFCSGLAEHDGNASVHIYPNPSNGMTNVVIAGMASQAELSIFNVQGQLAYTQVLHNENRVELDLSSLPAGIYVVRIRDERNTVIRKLIKE